MKKFDAINIEQSVIGSLISDNTLSFKLEELYEDLFTLNIHKYILNVMKVLYENNMAIDIQSVYTKLKDRDINIEISYLTDMVAIGESYSIDSHIRILKDKYLRREIIKNCTNLFQDLGDDEDMDLVVYNFEKRMREILNKNTKNYKDSVKDICERLLDYLENDENTGIKFGVEYLDNIIGGLFKGELTTIAARSGVGKTALALQIMLNCVFQKKKVLFISREMSNEQVFMRNITKKTGISTKKMKNKQLEDDEWKLVIDTFKEYSSQNLMYINDKISTISALKRRIRELEPDLVIIDYVQLMSVESIMQNREREVASLSRELKNITLDFNIPVIQLSQLNDEMKDFRPWGERPMRDSKAIFHDSNNVVYIHEPVNSDFEDAIKAIGTSREKVINSRKNGIKLVDLIVAKCRDGETGYRHYCYNGRRLHFQPINY